MIEFQEVYTTNRGSVFKQLRSCQVQVVFGNVLLNIGHDQLKAIRKFLSNTDDVDLETLKTCPSDKIIIAPGDSMLAYAFSVDEFVGFKHLITTALALLEVEDEVISILNK